MRKEWSAIGNVTAAYSYYFYILSMHVVTLNASLVRADTPSDKILDDATKYGYDLLLYKVVCKNVL